MPQYQYLDKKSEKTVDVIRTMSESDLLPTREECRNFTDQEFTTAEWQKLIGRVTFTRGSNWTGSKGNW